ncbi:MAG TPA: hypothetical protein VGK17_03125 [Propionicimonas sp.]|jgi:hypothetical protein
MNLIFGLLVALVVALVIALIATLIRKPDDTTTWVCVFCLVGFSRFYDAQVHLCEAHPRPNQTR